MEDVGQLEADFLVLVDVEAGGWLVGFTPLSEFLFFSAGALKPGDLDVLWPSTTPTTDTSDGSTRVGLRVSFEGSLAGVNDLASRFSFFSL